MAPLILIPCRSLRSGKTRLAGILSEPQRHDLCRTFLQQTLALALQLSPAENIRLVSSDAEAAELARRHGIACETDGDAGLNPALSQAVMAWRRQRADFDRQILLILPIDLVRADIGILQTLLAHHSDAVLAPDLAESGTNALRLPGHAAARFRFQFGDNSFARHGEEAGRLGLSLSILRDARLGFDLDNPADYAAWAGARS